MSNDYEGSPEVWDLYDHKGIRLNRTCRRGDALPPDTYHLAVFLWIKNSKGELLISRRSEQKIGAGLLETVGGAAVSGDDSRTAVIREAREELGLNVDSKNLWFLHRGVYPQDGPMIADIWMIETDADLDQLVLQKEEVSSVQWIPIGDVVSMIKEKTFFNSHIHKHAVPYLGGVFSLS